MGESTLEPSVSFGRFQNDSLSWEKWSSFSPNKYLEEVEKCSMPGSVAQKKAYFEAHYKKIAAQEAEQLEQEKLMESAPPRFDDLNKENCTENSTVNETEFVGRNSVGSIGEVVQEADLVVGNGGRLTEEVKLETDVVCDGWRSTRDELEDSVSSVINSTNFDDGKVDSVGAGVCERSSIEDIEEEVSGSHAANATELNDRQNILSLVEEHAPRKSSQDANDSTEVDSGTQMVRESESKNLKIKARNIAQKKTPNKKDPSLAGTKKKMVSPAAKSSPMSAPHLSRSTPTSASLSSRVTLTSAPRFSRATTSASVHTSKSSSKKLNGTPFPRNKNTPVERNRSSTPTALHMSLSLGPKNSSASLATTRRSLIMEEMADKDIIKRAFKTFQNFGQHRSFGEDKFNGMSSEVLERNPLTPSKENEGLRKAADKKITQRGQLESKSSPASSRLTSSAAKKNLKVAPSLGLKSDERADKRREFLKNLEQKSIARGVEKAQLSAKSNDKDGEKAVLKQNSKSTTTPARSYSRASGPKSLQKEGVKIKASLPNR